MHRRSLGHFAGRLLGGAIGDALGAPVEFDSLKQIREAFGPSGVTDYVASGPPRGRITDDTQMSLFTVEGLLRAESRRGSRGVCNAAAVVHHAHIRWLHTQGAHSKNRFFDEKDDGWLVKVAGLHARRAPGRTCLGALASGEMGTIDTPINDSKGCGGVMRAAPAGLFCKAGEALHLGCEIAATTHGHPSGYLASGCLAFVISRMVSDAGLGEAIEEVMPVLAEHPGHEECLRAIRCALRLADAQEPTPETVERLGGGWVAEEALAISFYCALAVEGDFTRGVLLAVNHSGDSDSTGSITGNLLGLLAGRRRLPAEWVRDLELRAEIEQIAADLFTRHRDGREWWDRYPGW